MGKIIAFMELIILVGKTGTRKRTGGKRTDFRE